MMQAHAKPNHDYHLVDPSPWPIIGAAAAFVMAIGAILWMKHIPIGGLKPGSYIFGAGLLGVLYVMFSWWSDVIKEAEHGGFHTFVVQISHRYGMILFIASEVMFFVAWFWAFFDASLFPGFATEYSRAEFTGGIGPEGHRSPRSLALPASQYPHSADLRYDRDLGPSRPPPRRPFRAEGRTYRDDSRSAPPSPRFRPTNMPMRHSLSKARSLARPFSWRRVFMVST